MLFHWENIAINIVFLPYSCDYHCYDAYYSYHYYHCWYYCYCMLVFVMENDSNQSWDGMGNTIVQGGYF
jgi:hypothetical protein